MTEKSRHGARVPPLGTTPAPGSSPGPVARSDRRGDEPDWLDDKSLAVRRLWVHAYRDWQSRETLCPSRYRPSPVWDGGADAYGRRRKPIWPRLADFITDNHLAAEAFVRAQFYGCKGNPPAPNMVMGAFGLANYRRYLARTPGDRALELRVQVNVLKLLLYRRASVSLPESEVLRGILHDETLELSPLYRYCVAVSAGLADAASLWHSLALSQYLTDPGGYDTAWGECVPRILREESPVRVVSGGFGP